MAEPWSSDFAALAERSQHGVRPLAAFSQPKETKMRFFKSHPALAAVVTLLVLGLVSGAAYAVVREVWVYVDPDKSAPELQQDLQEQLEDQGVHAKVSVDKPAEGKMQVRIMSTGSAGSDVDLEKLHVHVAGHEDDEQQTFRGIRFEVRCGLTEEQMSITQRVVTGDRFIDMLQKHASNDEIARAIKDELAAKGFHDVEVKVDADGIDVIVKSPPTP